LRITIINPVIPIFLFVACASSYKFTENYSSKDLSDIDINHVMLMVLYPDDMIETRVALETSMADEFNKNHVEAYCGYKSQSSYENLEDRVDEIKSALR
jgi:hypothetical protein